VVDIRDQLFSKHLQIGKAKQPKGALEIQILLRKETPCFWGRNWSPDSSPVLGLPATASPFAAIAQAPTETQDAIIIAHQMDNEQVQE
jgi:hypothetical protein